MRKNACGTASDSRLKSFVKRYAASSSTKGRAISYRVEIAGAVRDYLRSLEGSTREGRLAMIGFLDALRNYGDEARKECPRQAPGSTVFCLRWTFDAGPAIRSLDVYVDDSEGDAGLLEVPYAELVPL